MTGPLFQTLRYRWELDGLVFNDGSGRFCTEWTGWDSQPPVDYTRTRRTPGDGSYVGGTYYDGRPIGLSGVVGCADRAATALVKDQLTGLFTGKGRLGRYLVKKTEGTRTRAAWVVLDDPMKLTVMRDSLTVRWSVQVFAPDPFLMSGEPGGSGYQYMLGPIPLDDQGSTLTGTPYNGTQSPYPGTEWNGNVSPYQGIVYQTGTTSTGNGRLYLPNTGNADAPVLLTVRAITDTVNPSVTLLGTGERVVLGGTLTAGSVLTVDTATGRVEIGGVYSPGALSVAQMFRVPPGGDTVYFTSASLANRATLEVTYSNRHLSG